MKLKNDKIKKDFSDKIQLLQNDGYYSLEITFDFFTVNVISEIAMLAYVSLFFGIWYIFNNSIKSAFFVNRYTSLILLFFLFLVAIILHELIHGVCFACSNFHGWKAIHFGFNMNVFAPYCNCRELLSKKAYIISLVMPTVLLGFIPCVVASILGCSFLFLLGLFMIMAGGGDFLFFYSLLGIDSKNQKISILDHPYKAGYVLFVKKLDIVEVQKNKE